MNVLNKRIKLVYINPYITLNKNVDLVDSTKSKVYVEDNNLTKLKQDNLFSFSSFITYIKENPLIEEINHVCFIHRVTLNKLKDPFNSSVEQEIAFGLLMKIFSLRQELNITIYTMNREYFNLYEVYFKKIKLDIEVIDKIQLNKSDQFTNIVYIDKNEGITNYSYLKLNENVMKTVNHIINISKKYLLSNNNSILILLPTCKGIRELKESIEIILNQHKCKEFYKIYYSTIEDLISQTFDSIDYMIDSCAVYNQTFDYDINSYIQKLTFLNYNLIEEYTEYISLKFHPQTIYRLVTVSEYTSYINNNFSEINLLNHHNLEKYILYLKYFYIDNISQFDSLSSKNINVYSLRKTYERLFIQNIIDTNSSLTELGKECCCLLPLNLNESLSIISCLKYKYSNKDDIIKLISLSKVNFNIFQNNLKPITLKHTKEKKISEGDQLSVISIYSLYLYSKYKNKKSIVHNFKLDLNKINKVKEYENLISSICTKIDKLDSEANPKFNNIISLISNITQGCILNIAQKTLRLNVYSIIHSGVLVEIHESSILFNLNSDYVLFDKVYVFNGSAYLLNCVELNYDTIINVGKGYYENLTERKFVDQYCKETGVVLIDKTNTHIEDKLTISIKPNNQIKEINQFTPIFQKPLKIELIETQDQTIQEAQEEIVFLNKKQMRAKNDEINKIFKHMSKGEKEKKNNITTLEW